MHLRTLLKNLQQFTTAEGKTYRLVTSAGETIDGSHKYDENGVSISSQSSPSQGIVEAGVTKEVTYIYEEVPEAPVKRDDKAIVIYRHVDAQGSVVKELERTEEFAGKEGEPVSYTEAEKQSVIDKYRAQGYRLVQDQ